MLFQGKQFDIVSNHPESVLGKLDCKVVDCADFELVQYDGYCNMEWSQKRLEAAGVDNANDFEIIGHYFSDDTHFCEFEGKLEFCSTELLLVVRKTDLKAAMRKWLSSQAVGLTYKPFARLAS